jgi:glycosyltransferase involved in cell wall biosynthesis
MTTMSSSPSTRSEHEFDFELDAEIVLDARYLNGSESGIGRYTEQLIRRSLEIDPSIRFHLITHPERPEPVSDPRVSSEVFAAPADSPQTRWLLRHLRDLERGDLFHSPFNYLPGALDVPSVFTLHDIMWLIDPDYCTHRLWEKWISGSYYQWVIPRSVEEADRILTVSHHSRTEIEDYFPSVEGRVHATYNGVDPFFRPMSPEEGWPLIQEYVPPRSKFVLVVGQESPYKNHPGALAGFIEAFRDDPHVHFVLVGRLDKPPSGELKELMEDPDVASRIVEPGYVSRDQLRALYSLARVFLFPSFYEGFGLPSLEAMACGTPVVTSDRGAPEEIGGEAAVCVDPSSPEAIGDALEALARDDDFYEARREACLSRAAEFTWRRCAAQTLEVYREML